MRVDEVRERREKARAARRENRLGQRRRGILRAAARIFQEVGYDRATLESIGEAVGLSKGSLYYYVRSKEELLARLFAELIEKMDREACEGLKGTVRARERLRSFLNAHVHVVCSDPSGHLLATHQDTVLGAADSGLMRAARRRHEGRLRKILEEGIAEGAFRPMNVRVNVYLILGALSGVGRWYSPAGSAHPEEIAENLFALVLGGIESEASRAPLASFSRAGRPEASFHEG